MIYGNHNKRKGDIVKIAAWDEPALLNVAESFRIYPQTIKMQKEAIGFVSSLEFAVIGVDYNSRKIIISPIGVNGIGIKSPAKAKNLHVAVNLDETNLIRVSRMTEERV